MMTPTKQIRFEKLQEKHIPFLKLWFEDSELQRWINVSMDEWIRYALTNPICHLWIAYDGNIPVGFAQLDFGEDHTGYLSFAVDPSRTRSGYGKSILKGLLELSEVKTLVRIEGTVEPENIPSQRCLQSAGYILVDDIPDEDGLLLFVYDIK